MYNEYLCIRYFELIVISLLILCVTTTNTYIDAGVHVVSDLDVDLQRLADVDGGCQAELDLHGTYHCQTSGGGELKRT